MRKLSALIAAILMIGLASCSSYTCPTYAKVENPAQEVLEKDC